MESEKDETKYSKGEEGETDVCDDHENEKFCSSERSIITVEAVTILPAMTTDEEEKHGINTLSSGTSMQGNKDQQTICHITLVFLVPKAWTNFRHSVSNRAKQRKCSSETTFVGNVSGLSVTQLKL